jgi:hypothetical protein
MGQAKKLPKKNIEICIELSEECKLIIFTLLHSFLSRFLASQKDYVRKLYPDLTLSFSFCNKDGAL